MASDTRRGSPTGSPAVRSPGLPAPGPDHGHQGRRPTWTGPGGRHGRDPVLRLRRAARPARRAQRAQAEGRQVRLVVTGAQVRRILALTALDCLIAVYTSLDQALAHPPATGHTEPGRMIVSQARR